VVAFLYIAALVIAAASVSVLGAAFSVSGLSRLFSGSAMAVAMMASALEFSKFVVAAFLHRTWKQLNPLYRTYLFLAVVVLSVITSMGIFGFLSDAYQTSSVDLAATQIKIDALKGEQSRNVDEIARLNRSIDEIPANRISKKILARKEAEPVIQELTKKSDRIAEELKQMDLKNLDVKMKVGPLIYVARAFKQDIDTVVKWLILVFVAVFDPLAICLVIATSEALKLKSMGLLSGTMFSRAAEQHYAPVPASSSAPFTEMATEASPDASAQTMAQAVDPGLRTETVAKASSPQTPSTDEIIRMRYVDDPDSKAG
jgi:hypothetical protein